MNAPQIFVICNTVVLVPWLLVLVAPRWPWTQRLATFVMPLFFATVYAFFVITTPKPPGSGFATLAAVSLLFTQPAAVLAGWLHYLAFDLFTGSWISRDAIRLGISPWAAAPCLALTFLAGPIGLAAYLLLRVALRRQIGVITSDGAACVASCQAYGTEVRA